MKQAAWITTDTVFHYISDIIKEGWGLREMPTDDSPEKPWHLVYLSYQTEFDVYLNFTEEWVYFQAPLLKPGTQIHRECRTALYEYLLRLNDAVHLASFAMGPDDRILLNVEIPSESFDYMAFRNATQALATYLDRYFTEISIVAQQKEFGQFIEQEKFSPETEDDLEINLIIEDRKT